MTNNELFALLIGIIQTAEPDFGIPNVTGKPGVPVYQSYQPTQQGVPSAPAAFLEIVGSQRIGQPYRNDYFDPDTDEMVHKEVQQMLTQFQISALVNTKPADTTQLLASDIIDIFAMILQNSQTIEILEASDCGIQLASATRNPKFLNDRDRFQASPSFDFNITHKLIVTRSQNVIESTELQILPV